MISQREADRRVFQRKQDALHKELREFVEARRNGERSVCRGPFTEGSGLSEGSSGRPLTFEAQPWWAR